MVRRGRGGWDHGSGAGKEEREREREGAHVYFVVPFTTIHHNASKPTMLQHPWLCADVFGVFCNKKIKLKNNTVGGP
jgi:hypothetical protein